MAWRWLKNGVIDMKRIILSLAVSIFTLGLLFLVCDLHHKAETQHTDRKVQAQKAIYHCPMHPNYISDKPGDCPICGMKLVPIEEEKGQMPGEAVGGKVSGYSTVKITPEKQQLIGVTTAIAEKKNLTKTIRTVGRIAFDPELYKAEEEFIQALKSYNQLKNSPLKETQEAAKSLVEASKLRLKLMGLGEAQIKELEDKKEADTNLLIAQEDANVWLYATIYESDLDLVKVGQDIEAQASAYPGEIFEGKIVSLDPILEAQTRSVRARALVDNKKGKLKPEMYADVEIKVDLGGNLVIPESAVLDSGTRKIVFIDRGDGYFEPREVKLGQGSDDLVIVLDGIKEGEKVIKSGNFLIDSESKLKSAIGETTHKHGE